jgi:hypothetical protein
MDRPPGIHGAYGFFAVGLTKSYQIFAGAMHEMHINPRSLIGGAHPAEREHAKNNQERFHFLPDLQDEKTVAGAASAARSTRRDGCGRWRLVGSVFIS